MMALEETTIDQYRQMAERVLLDLEYLLMHLAEKYNLETQKEIGEFLCAYNDYCIVKKGTPTELRIKFRDFELELLSCISNTFRRETTQKEVIKQFVKREIDKRIQLLAGNGYEIL